MVYRNKSLVGYSVRRNMTLWGQKREIGEFIPVKEVASIARIDSFVRSGRFNQVFEEGGQRVERSRGGAKIRVFEDSQGDVPEVVEEPEAFVPPVKKAVAKKTPAKKTADKTEE